MQVTISVYRDSSINSDVPNLRNRSGAILRHRVQTDLHALCQRNSIPLHRRDASNARETPEDARVRTRDLQGANETSKRVPTRPETHRRDRAFAPPHSATGIQKGWRMGEIGWMRCCAFFMSIGNELWIKLNIPCPKMSPPYLIYHSWISTMLLFLTTFKSCNIFMTCPKCIQCYFRNDYLRSSLLVMMLDIVFTITII